MIKKWGINEIIGKKILKRLKNMGYILKISKKHY